MDPRLLGWLRCPACHCRLDSAAEQLVCSSCGVHYPVRQGIPIFTGEDTATAEAFGYLWGEPASAEQPVDTTPSRHLKKMADALGAPPLAGLVLEGGCGAGVDLAAVATDGACEVVGVELSNGGIATSRARTRGLSGAHLVQGDLLALPLGDALFDAAYSYGVVHHTPDPQRAVSEIARALKPGAPFMLYVYEDFSTRPWYWRAALSAVNSLRAITTRLPHRLFMAVCRAMSPVVYVLCTLPSRHFRFAARFPYRHGTGPMALTGDLYDRFSAPIEYRYSEAGARALAEGAGLRVLRSVELRGWAVLAVKP